MSPSENLKEMGGLLHILKEMKWGEYSLLALYISVLSGVIVALQYDPATPLYSVSTLDFLVPFGAYFRSLHFYSSQLFFLFCICHLFGIFEQAQSYSRKQWIILTATLPVGLLILFTGYLLRADSTGFSAGMIAESILLDIPYIGKSINDLLFSITENGMKRVYVNHIIGFGILWGWLAWGHIRKFRVSFNHHTLLTVTILLFSLFVAAPLEPDHLGVTHISGPWFFLGLQELLRYLPPVVAGVLFPLTFLTALVFLQKRNKGYRYFFLFSLCWLFFYILLTGIEMSR
ncbi:MAG: cytochrome b N-terminal domain-containing protein [Desulfocapsa sp.]|nr:cytochrome b N-terminal domain-containing protein [Desulfocapsa sp.]